MACRSDAGLDASPPNTDSGNSIFSKLGSSLAPSIALPIIESSEPYPASGAERFTLWDHKMRSGAT